MSLTQQLRRAIKDSGLTLYRVAKDTHTPYAVIHGFVNDKNRDIKLGTADRLADLFGMELTAPKAARTAAATGRKLRNKKGG